MPRIESCPFSPTLVRCSAAQEACIDCDCGEESRCGLCLGRSLLLVLLTRDEKLVEEVWKRREHWASNRFVWIRMGSHCTLASIRNRLWSLEAGQVGDAGAMLQLGLHPTNQPVRSASFDRWLHDAWESQRLTDGGAGEGET